MTEKMSAQRLTFTVHRSPFTVHSIESPEAIR